MKVNTRKQTKILYAGLCISLTAEKIELKNKKKGLDLFQSGVQILSGLIKQYLAEILSFALSCIIHSDDRENCATKARIQKITAFNIVQFTFLWLTLQTFTPCNAMQK